MRTYFISWYGSLNLKNRKRSQDTIKVFVTIAGTFLNDLSHLHKVRTLKRAQSALPDPNHPLFKDFKQQIQCANMQNYMRFKNSFVLTATGLLI